MKLLFEFKPSALNRGMRLECDMLLRVKSIRAKDPRTRNRTESNQDCKKLQDPVPGQTTTKQ